MNYEYIVDFTKERENKIGASEICCCVPHPVKQVHSLNAYHDGNGIFHAETALDLYNRKINKEKSLSGFAADIGHWLEGKILSAFIADHISKEIASDFLRGYTMHKIEQDNSREPISPLPFNNTAFRHNTKAENEYATVHADCLYDPSFSKIKDVIKKDKMTIDMSKPFIIEAKSASLWSSKRKDDPYVGYDLTLSGWQSIPLKTYFQIQMQMHVYNVDIAYLALIYNTNAKHFFEIKANKKHQLELEQIARYMKKCIDDKTPPNNLLMNAKDIQSLYPVLSEDFRELKNDELTEVLKIAMEEIEASAQEKEWKRKKEAAADQLSIHLKDTKVLKGNIDGVIMDIAKWKDTGGSEGVMGLTEIRKREDALKVEKYLRRNKLIKTSEEKRKPSVVIKLKDME